MGSRRLGRGLDGAGFLARGLLAGLDLAWGFLLAGGVLVAGSASS